MVEGDPTPEVKWFLEGEEDVDLENDEEFIIEYKSLFSIIINFEQRRIFLYTFLVDYIS